MVKYEDQMNSFCDDDPKKQKLASKMIRDLTSLAKDDQDGGPMLRTNTLTLSKPKKSHNNFANDNKLLGFKNTVNPTQDFKTPPGLLALTLMHTFAMTNGEDFLRLGKIMAVRVCIHISCQSPILIVESMSYSRRASIKNKNFYIFQNWSFSFSKFTTPNIALPVKTIYLENLMLETTNCAMKTVA